MLTPVPVGIKSLEDYRPIIGDAATDEILALSRPLRGSRVLHVNATSFGGGVAEILHTLVPLLRDVGIEAEWRVMEGNDEFFDVTKTLHNAMQGMYVPWTSASGETWRRVNRANAANLEGRYDYVFVHDPQPAGILHYVQEQDPQALGAHWIWRCHLDTTESVPEVWDFLRPYVDRHQAAVFTREEYIKEDLRTPEVAIIPPAIDPLSTKNIDIAPSIVQDIVHRYQIDPQRPIIAQVSRFDPWKDPLGVIDVYRAVKESHPDLQLLMVAAMADDDPEGWSFYERIVRRAGEDYDIHILTNLNGVGNLEVNAFQRAAHVVLQKSIREGFGLVVSEALWKGRPVVGGAVGGIPMQMMGGRCGFLASSTAEFIEIVSDLLEHPDKAAEVGARGKENVREHFLITRLLRDNLQLMNRLAAAGPQPPPPDGERRPAGRRRQPVATRGGRGR